jgi:hypothetical protein
MSTFLLEIMKIKLKNEHHMLFFQKSHDCSRKKIPNIFHFTNQHQMTFPCRYGYILQKIVIIILFFLILFFLILFLMIILFGSSSSTNS